MEDRYYGITFRHALVEALSGFRWSALTSPIGAWCAECQDRLLYAGRKEP